jgi:hypothetical protein
MTGQKHLLRDLPFALTLAYAVTVAGLVALRALVDELDFLSIGWIVVLALVPLMPWLLPAIGPVLERITPFIESVRLPLGIEIPLRPAAREAAPLGQVEDVLTQDHLIHGLTQTATPFQTTDALRVIAGVQEMRRSGAEAVVVDLGSGVKWRLPNLYFLAWLLAHDSLTRWLVFTETDGEKQGVFVGICSVAELSSRIEAVHPAYAGVRPQLEFSDPAVPRHQLQLTGEFNKIRAAVAAPQAGEVPTLAWVASGDLRNLLGPHLVTVSVSWTERLDRAGLETIIRSTVPYVAATTDDGRLHELIEQRQVALELTRGILQAK